METSKGNQANPSTPINDSLPPTSKAAIASVVLGFLSLILTCAAGIPGVILAILALVRINKSEGRLKGFGLAVTGLLLSVILSIVSAGGGILVGMLLPAVEQVREAERRTEDAKRIEELSEAAHNYHDAHQHRPPETKQPSQGDR